MLVSHSVRIVGGDADPGAEDDSPHARGRVHDLLAAVLQRSKAKSTSTSLSKERR